MLKRLLPLFASLVLVASAFGQDSWASRDHQFASRQLNDFIVRFQHDLVVPVSRGVRSKAAARPVPTGVASTSTTTVPPRRTRLTQELAAAYPVEERRHAEQAFDSLLSGYVRIERQFGIVHYDVAGALAAFIAGAYMAYRNTAIPDPHFAVLDAQMRQILDADPGFRNAVVEAKQEMYERLAILGMSMAQAQAALQWQPDAALAASMRRTAEAYLIAFLRADADLVQIGARGLVIRWPIN